MTLTEGLVTVSTTEDTAPETPQMIRITGRPHPSDIHMVYPIDETLLSYDPDRSRTWFLDKNGSYHNERGQVCSPVLPGRYEEFTVSEEFDISHVEQVVAMAAYRDGWRAQQQASVVTRIITWATGDPTSCTMRDAIRGVYSDFTYGDSREEFRKMEAILLAKVAEGWRPDMTQVFTAALAKMRGYVDERVRGLLQRWYGDGRVFLNLNHLATTVASEAWGGRHDDVVWILDRSEVREFLRTWFTFGELALDEEVAAMDADAARTEVMNLRTQREAMTTMLHMEADRRGLCSEFDAIARKAGLPPRPRNYTIRINVRHRHQVTQDYLRSVTGRTIELELPEGATAYVTGQTQVAVSRRYADEPDYATALADVQDQLPGLVDDYAGRVEGREILSAEVVQVTS